MLFQAAVIVFLDSIYSFSSFLANTLYNNGPPIFVFYDYVKAFYLPCKVTFLISCGF